MKKIASLVLVALLFATCSFASEDRNTQEGAATGGASAGQAIGRDTAGTPAGAGDAPPVGATAGKAVDRSRPDEKTAASQGPVPVQTFSPAPTGESSGRWAVEPGGWVYGEYERRRPAPANP